jgi:peptidoglycan/xylan/chitin deacetylase (PgdA/CDA1 family)
MLKDFRHSCRIVVGNVLYGCGVFSLLRFFRAVVFGRREVCILGLHRVMSRDDQARTHSLPGIILTDETFRGLLEHLRRSYQIVPLEKALHVESAPRRWRKPLCVITFDDGWRDNYTTAFPLLKSFRMPATIFLATGFIGKRQVFWVERLRKELRSLADQGRIPSEITAKLPPQCRATTLHDLIEHLKHMTAEERRRALAHLFPFTVEPPPANDTDEMLSWEQATEMSRQGIEFGSHTETHPLLTYEDDATVDQELSVSLETIREKLGRRARFFAYPNGDQDDRIRKAVQAAGYECAVTTAKGWHHPKHDRYRIRRIMLHDGNITGSNGKFSAAMFSLTVARQD